MRSTKWVWVRPRKPLQAWKPSVPARNHWVVDGCGLPVVASVHDKLSRSSGGPGAQVGGQRRDTSRHHGLWRIQGTSATRSKSVIVLLAVFAPCVGGHGWSDLVCMVIDGFQWQTMKLFGRFILWPHIMPGLPTDPALYISFTLHLP